MSSRKHRILSDAPGMFPEQGEGNVTSPRSNATEKPCRKIELGLLHFSKKECRQVRTKYGGGPRLTTVEKKTTVRQILEMGKKLFFPNGISTKAPTEDFTLEVCGFKRNPINSALTVGGLHEQTKRKLLRSYICTKEKFPLSACSSEEDECHEDISDESMTDTQLRKHGSHIDANDEILELTEDGYSSNSDWSKQACGSRTQICLIKPILNCC